MKRALAQTGMAAAAIERELEKLPAQAEAEPVEMDAEDEGLAASLFLALGTQWRTAGMAGTMQGLDYQAIEPTARLIGIEPKPRLLLHLQTMEAEALKCFAEQAKRASSGAAERSDAGVNSGRGL